MELSQRIESAATYLRQFVPFRPRVGLILGSGLGDYADTLQSRICVPFSDIPDFPQTTVEGHKGAFVFGYAQGVPVVALQGRLHYYEGHKQSDLTIPVRVMALLGAETLVLTNAAGGVNLNYFPGDLMLISDHINFSGSNPLMGPNMAQFGPRFPDMSDLYSKELRKAITKAAEAEGIPLRQGIYLMYSGPNYETPAEIRAFRLLGADAVGMSTVPEALVAAHCGMKVVGVSCITNMAAGVLPRKLDHSEVMETAAAVKEKFRRLVELILRTLS